MRVVVAAAFYTLTAPVVATPQEADILTTVASLGSGSAISRINFEAVKPRPATDRRLQLPALALTDDGSGPRLRHLVMELPDLDFGVVSVASRLGYQSLPAVFRAAPLAGSALASPMRGLTLTTTSSAPIRVFIGRMPVPATGRPPTSLALAGAAVSFTPSSRLFVTPQVLIPSGSPDAQTSVGKAIRADVIEHLALMTDVGMAGTANTAWAPLAAVRLIGQWSRAGIETSVRRGAPATRTAAATAFVSSGDRDAVQAQLEPLPGLTLATLASSSRPSSDPDADDTTLGSLRVAYDGLRSGQVAAVRQREATASRQSEFTSLEWRQRGPGRLTVRYVHQRASDSALAEADEGSSRVEVDLPVLAPRCAGCLDLRAALTAGSSSLTDSSLNSRVSGRVGLIDNVALTGETELGLTGGDGQMLRALRVTAELPVVPATHLQLSYACHIGGHFSLGQVFEASIRRRLSLGR
jgi:hypothetical protein